MRPSRPALAALAAVVLAALTGCSSASSGSAGRPNASGSALSGRITVFAAASLTEAFSTLGRQFQAAHPGTTVTFSFGASSALAQQIIQGAPADVFASASPANMDQVVAAKAAAGPSPFAKNVMEIAVPPANPGHVTALADLAKPALKVALCAPQVPCGKVARQVLAKAKLSVTPVSQEPDVKSTLTKVELGEVDAGIVYVTDVRAAGGKVSGIAIPDTVNASTSYPIAALSGSANPGLARAFVDFVRSETGGTVLTAAGFERP